MLFVKDTPYGLCDRQVTSRIFPFLPLCCTVYRRNDVDACEHGRGEAPQGVCWASAVTDRFSALASSGRGGAIRPDLFGSSLRSAFATLL